MYCSILFLNIEMKITIYFAIYCYQYCFVFCSILLSIAFFFLKYWWKIMLSTLLSVMTRIYCNIVVLLFHLGIEISILEGHLQNSPCPARPGSNCCLVCQGKYFLSKLLIWTYDCSHILSKFRCHFLLANVALMFIFLDYYHAPSIVWEHTAARRRSSQ